MVVTTFFTGVAVGVASLLQIAERRQDRRPLIRLFASNSGWELNGRNRCWQGGGSSRRRGRGRAFAFDVGGAVDRVGEAAGGEHQRTQRGGVADEGGGGCDARAAGQVQPPSMMVRVSESVRNSTVAVTSAARSGAKVVLSASMRASGPSSPPVVTGV